MTNTCVALQIECAKPPLNISKLSICHYTLNTMIDVLGSLHRNQGYAIFTGALMTILTTIAVALKLLSRWLNKNKLGMDDWLIMIAQLLWYPQYALQLYGKFKNFI